MTWGAGRCVPGVVKQLLADVHPTRATYHGYRDRILPTAVLEDLKAIMDENSPIHLDPRWMAPVMDHYLSLLLCDDASVSQAAKSALQRTMKTEIDAAGNRCLQCQAAR